MPKSNFIHSCNNRLRERNSSTNKSGLQDKNKKAKTDLIFEFIKKFKDLIDESKIFKCRTLICTIPPKIAVGVKILKTTVKNPPTVADIPPITPAKVASHRIHLKLVSLLRLLTHYFYPNFEILAYFSTYQATSDASSTGCSSVILV